MAVSFPIRAGEPAQALGRELLSVLDRDTRVAPNAVATAKISKVVDLSDPAAGVVELTISTDLAPEHADGVKSALFEAANAFVARRRDQKAVAA